MMPEANQSDSIPEQPLIDLRDSRKRDRQVNRPSPDILRVLAIGHPDIVHGFVMLLFKFGYARPDEWSSPLPTINEGEVMQILTKRVSLTQ
jgi:hypothetical protein